MKKKELVKLIEDFDDDSTVILYGYSPKGDSIFAVDIKSISGNEYEIHIESEIKLTPVIIGGTHVLSE